MLPQRTGLASGNLQTPRTGDGEDRLLCTTLWRKNGLDHKKLKNTVGSCCPERLPALASEAISY